MPGIQYAAAYRLKQCRLWNTGSSAFADDDSARRSDPSGKSSNSRLPSFAFVQPQREKYFAFPETRSGVGCAHLIPARGAVAIVTNAGWDAVDAGGNARRTLPARLRQTSRRTGTGSAARCWRRHLAYGEVVWSWRPDAGVKLACDAAHHADDGGKKARSPGRARNKPSDHCAGNAGLSRLNLYARVRFLFSAKGTRDRGCSQHPAFPAPSS